MTGSPTSMQVPIPEGFTPYLTHLSQLEGVTVRKWLVNGTSALKVCTKISLPPARLWW